MPQSFTCLNYHIVFSTKNRLPQISSEWRPRLHEYIGGILRAQDSILLAAGGTSDHLHLLAVLGKTTGIAEVLRVIKANSSGWVHKTMPDQQEFGWQAGYAAFTVSYSGLDHVKKYIARQEEHHRKRTYHDELIALLQKHNLPYEERFLWD